MKRILALSLLWILSTGCSSVGMAKLASALAKDPATVSVSLQSVYGTAKLVRTNPGTNSVVTVTPDGTVTVDRK